jgi:hypothetical protein
LVASAIRRARLPFGGHIVLPGIDSSTVSTLAIGAPALCSRTSLSAKSCLHAKVLMRKLAEKNSGVPNPGQDASSLETL